MVKDVAFVGTELKYALTITEQLRGFSMDDDDFSVEVVCGNDSIQIPKSECIDDGNGNWYFAFDSTNLGPGLVTAVITAYVPDNDMPDGLRTEVDEVELCILRSTKKTKSV